MENSNFNWDSNEFFSQLASTNKLALELGAKFCRVSGLQGFQDAISAYKSAKCLICASDISDGTLYTDNSPHTRKAKIVFFALRCPIDDMQARELAMSQMRELFRQFASRTLLEKNRLAQNNIYIDDTIPFREIDRHFFSGFACCYFQLAVSSFTDLSFRSEEWTQ